ncbi:MAG: tetratricopeptide repeat protein [Desulfomonilaceae bacterium]
MTGLRHKKTEAVEPMITIFRRVLFAAIISAALSLSVGLAYSDQKNEDLAATIEENLKAGRIPEAETQAQKFLQQAREKYRENDKQTLHAKLLLANVYREAGKFDEAAALIQSCLAANEKAFGPDDPSLVEPLAALGMLMQVQNKLPEAESAFRRALAIDAKKPSTNRMPIIELKESLALIRAGEGDLAESTQLLEQVLAERERAAGANSEEYATTLNNLASIYAQQERYDEAIILQEKALRVLKDAVGQDNLTNALFSQNMAGFLLLAGKKNEAEQALASVPALLEKHLGPTHPALSEVLLELAELNEQLGNSAKAKELQKRATEVQAAANKKGQ